MKLPTLRLVLLAWVLPQIFAAPASAAEFRASAVKVDITPDRPQWLLGYQARQSDDVNDRLYRLVVALDMVPARGCLSGLWCK